MNKKIPLYITILLLVFWGTKLIISSGVIDTIEWSIKDKFTYQMGIEIKNASDQDILDFITTILKESKQKLPVKTSEETVLFNIENTKKHIIYKLKTNYKSFLSLEHIHNDENKLKKQFQKGIINEVCSQGLFNTLIENNSVTIQHIYFDLSLKEKVDYTVKKADCKKWENENKVYSFTKNIKYLYQSIFN